VTLYAARRSALSKQRREERSGTHSRASGGGGDGDGRRRSPPSVALLPWSVGDKVVVNSERRTAAPGPIQVLAVLVTDAARRCERDCPSADAAGSCGTAEASDPDLQLEEAADLACQSAIAANRAGIGAQGQAGGGLRLVYVVVGGEHCRRRAKLSAYLETRGVCRHELDASVRQLTRSFELREVLTAVKTGLVLVTQAPCSLSPSVSLQALHSGLPVVGWAMAPLNETVTNCHNALLVSMPRGLFDCGIVAGR
jgi:hypothetical protein